MSKVWFVTGAGRGMGLEIAKAALQAGHKVVATGRKIDSVAKAVGESTDLLVVKLDVTNASDAKAAAQATIDRFGRIDVLVNNAANFYAGYFEELTPEQMDLQLATSLRGPMNVTRAFLPVMRKQLWEGHLNFIYGGARRVRVLYRLFCIEVRPRWLDGSIAGRSWPIRHSNNDCQSGRFPHGTSYQRIDDVRRALH
jgi:NAD(P)-dependent dehydrogenase (short-subunit alcohol dehydrogenase family)